VANGLAAVLFRRDDLDVAYLVATLVAMAPHDVLATKRAALMPVPGLLPDAPPLLSGTGCHVAPRGFCGIGSTEVGIGVRDPGNTKSASAGFCTGYKLSFEITPSRAKRRETKKDNDFNQVEPKGQIGEVLGFTSTY
jgi:hypothetical protein